MTVRQIAIIGCGIVGATIAYELSQNPDLNITVIDRQQPALAATGAALGVLMGYISQKKEKSRAWRLRSVSMQRYATLIPELEAQIGATIPRNDRGILKLCNADEDLGKWEKLVAIRARQGLTLEQLTPQQTCDRYPQLNCDEIAGAIYSPHDRQIDPVALTQALVRAAQNRGVTFQFHATVTEIETESDPQSIDQMRCHRIHYRSNDSHSDSLTVDWAIVAAGLGSTPLTTTLSQPVPIQPVLGQALHLQLDQPHALPQPVVTANDIHIVPLNETDCWVGATVEMPDDRGEVVADANLLDRVLHTAIAVCPALSQATILRQWWGLRPRPQGQSAPIIDRLAGYSNVLLATGHYRNGVLLAPATALEIRAMI
jgi:glycine/D-amino acid oxidase-like deaminating enzyme